jgi:hypothetical protein
MQIPRCCSSDQRQISYWIWYLPCRHRPQVTGSREPHQGLPHRHCSQPAGKQIAATSISRYAYGLLTADVQAGGLGGLGPTKQLILISLVLFWIRTVMQHVVVKPCDEGHCGGTCGWCHNTIPAARYNYCRLPFAHQVCVPKIDEAGSEPSCIRPAPLEKH